MSRVGTLSEAVGETRKTPGEARPTAPGFSPREAKDLIHDLFEPNPVLYWTDFILTIAVAYGCAAVYLFAEAFSLTQLSAFLISGLALFRAGTFIHEIVHMQRGSMLGFRIAWNLVYGVPLLMHSLLYSNHLDHHNPHKYGTPADGEYLPLGSAPMRETLLYLAQIPILPIFAIFRVLVLVPLSFLHPRLRRWLLERASSYGTNPYYRRTIPPTERQGMWVVMDLLCFLFLVMIATLVLNGVIAWTTIGQLYCLAAYAIGLNWIRTLAAHRYRNTGNEMTYTEQIEDSINLGGHSLLTLLLFPIGLRYHALHHVFPSLPYHAMGEAHRRLMGSLPENSPYRKTMYPGMWAVARDMVRGARQAGKTGRNPMQVWRGVKAAS